MYNSFLINRFKFKRASFLYSFHCDIFYLLFKNAAKIQWKNGRKKIKDVLRYGKEKKQNEQNFVKRN